MSAEGLLIPVSAPSGTGKTTVCNQLIDKSEKFEFSVSCTTRSPREEEEDGQDYHFVSKEKFEELIKNDELVEWEKVFDNYYGTLKQSLDNAIKNNKFLLLDIDVKGAKNIKEQYPEDTFAIFLKPPSIEELKRRLGMRGTEDEKKIKERNARIKEEMQYEKYFDYSIINNDLEKTVNTIYQKIKERGQV